MSQLGEGICDRMRNRRLPRCGGHLTPHSVLAQMGPVAVLFLVIFSNRCFGLN
ncbi:MAG: hypothetical protein RLZZ123_895 [Pseudomonadota bacterium]